MSQPLIINIETLKAACYEDAPSIDAYVVAALIARFEEALSRHRAIFYPSAALAFECNGFDRTRAPSRATYNTAFEALDAERRNSPLDRPLYISAEKQR